MPGFFIVESKEISTGGVLSFFQNPVPDTLEGSAGTRPDTLQPNPADSLFADTLSTDTAPGRRRTFLDDIVKGSNEDSLVYDVRSRIVYIYKDGDVSYSNLNIKSDYIQWNLDEKLIHAQGMPDTAGVYSKTEFKQGTTVYVMDTLVYNTETKKAIIRGVNTKEGEGFLHSDLIKKVSDELINIKHGRYTTCDLPHPHFFLSMARAQVIPNKKAIFGPSYMVVEDVPLYFIGLPFGFFPLMSSRTSGFIIPEVGEETVKGFFLRDGGYYYTPNDFVDFTLLGGIYTLGSWQASVASNYKKRYRYSGGFTFSYSKDILGEKGATDYVNTNNFRITWRHQQDSKFRPGSAFSASVDFSTNDYNKYSTTTIKDYLNTQTSSSISYQKSWQGTPFSFSTSFQHSQNSRDTTISLTVPNFTLSMSRVNPFKRTGEKAVGRQRWYEKISVNYTGNFRNSVRVHERDLFSQTMFKEMKNGMNHSIPVSTSLSLFGYLNLSPSFNYTERWYFSKIEKQWNPDTQRVEITDTIPGFFRVYDYAPSVGFSTTLFGMYSFGKKFPVSQIRHVLTTTISPSFTPDFGSARFGYYRPIQTDSTGTIGYYSPYENGIFGVPGRGRSASISLSLNNTLEMKVRSKKDSTGLRKIKVLERLSINTGYNFLADSMNLSPFSIGIGAPLVKDIGINVSMTFDPYAIDADGRRYNRFMLRDGKLGRITSISTGFGYSFNSTLGSGQPAINNNTAQGAGTPEQESFFARQQVSPEVRRQMLASQYYDFSIPWNFSFSYSFTYNKPGLRASIVQTTSFSASVNLTQRFGLTMNAGYDFEAKTLTPGTITMSRDLHCWQMSFWWVPTGFRSSWGFSIRAKSALLRDLKYDRRRSFLQDLYSD